MGDQDSSKPEVKKPNVTADEIANFLERTGFVFEMRASEVFKKWGYATEISEEFFDLEGNTYREIDIIATKIVNNINLHLVVECKQSQTEKWIFICNKQLGRYYYALKHLPHVATSAFREKKVFSGSHIFDSKVPLAHNYLCYTTANNKKSDHLHIDECVHKLPKALLDVAAKTEEGNRHLFFPVALFSGQIFSATYHGKLVVEEKPFLQYYVRFQKAAYNQQPETKINLSIFPSLHEILGNTSEQRVRALMGELSAHYHIDFVTEAGLPDYLTMIENEVGAVRTEYWDIPDAPKQETGI